MRHDLVGQSEGIVRLRAELPRVAASDASVLIWGETGSGKGLVARALHARSARRGRPFVHVDCAALSPTVIESELFGHERGAFTDAVARRPGRFELAGRGTLFLDEIGDLAPELQAKLLRVLQDREYERVGGVETLHLRARVVAATHRDLPAQVAAGRFRSDLFYRLDVLSLRVPPLRERREDLPALLEQLQAAFGVTEPPTPDVLDALAQHDWPGNVRELANVVERVLTLEGRLDPVAIERALSRRPAPASAKPLTHVRPDEAMTRERVVRVLAECGGNVRRAARSLGIPRSTLRYRIERWSLGHLLPGRGGR